MGNEFEKKALEKLSNIEKIVEGLDTLNRNIEKLIKILVKREGEKE